MFKVIGPTTAGVKRCGLHTKHQLPVSSNLQHTVSLIQKHGFGSAESFLYPINVCRRLAALLRESNAMYPVARRAFQGLDVGWLNRS
jgi:ubiquitin-protein ligase E3 D